jgi:hypothetical protein
VKGDFSRFVVDTDTYSRVLMQQGRVMVDSDWNDHVAMVVGSHRGLAADLIGRHGGPAPHPGFAVAPVTTNGKPDLSIAAGAYYVDGVRCVNAGPPDGAPNSPYRYLTQPYRASVGMGDVPGAGPYLVYLDVWERHVTALEDDAIREVALGGPDTTTRAQVVWQVRILSLVGNPWKKWVGNPTCASFPLDVLDQTLAGNPPRMKARAKDPEDVADDPCLSSPDARFRGPENQLYRVEIHAVDGDVVTFVWSRENGSVVAEWLGTEGDDLRVAGVRDKVRGFEAGDWVELVDDGLELGSQAGVLVRLARVDRDRLTVDPTTATGPIGSNPNGLVNARVRRWDQRQRAGAALVGGAVKVRTGTGEGDWIALEDGIEVQFQPPPANTTFDYRVGDFWVIPARVATGDVIWPRDAQRRHLAIRPHGIEHHHAPLAFVPAAAAAGAAAPAVKVIDLRHQFAPLAKCIPT